MAIQEISAVQELFASLSPEDQRRFKKLDVFATIAKANAQEDIDFSNQTVFTLAGADMPLAQVILIALSGMTISAEYEDKDKSKAYVGDNPKVAGLLSDAWAILKRVKAGKLAQEQEWSNTRASLAAFVEANI